MAKPTRVSTYGAGPMRECGVWLRLSRLGMVFRDPRRNLVQYLEADTSTCNFGLIFSSLGFEEGPRKSEMNVILKLDQSSYLHETPGECGREYRCLHARSPNSRKLRALELCVASGHLCQIFDALFPASGSSAACQLSKSTSTAQALRCLKYNQATSCHI